MDVLVSVRGYSFAGSSVTIRSVYSSGGAYDFYSRCSRRVTFTVMGAQFFPLSRFSLLPLLPPSLEKVEYCTVPNRRKASEGFELSSKEGTMCPLYLPYEWSREGGRDTNVTSAEEMENLEKQAPAEGCNY